MAKRRFEEDDDDIDCVKKHSLDSDEEDDSTSKKYEILEEEDIEGNCFREQNWVGVTQHVCAGGWVFDVFFDSLVSVAVSCVFESWHFRHFVCRLQK